MNAQPLRDDEQQTLDALESPGKRLRIARQAKGLGLNDLASQLHLSVSVIKALENDDFDRLPGPVFVRGYIRNYARLLGLDETEILGAFHRACPDDTYRPPAVHAGARQEIRSSHLGVRVASWVIVIGLLGLLAAWWQGRLEWAGELTMPSGRSESPPAVRDDGSLALPEPEPQFQVPAVDGGPADPAVREPSDFSPEDPQPESLRPGGTLPVPAVPGQTPTPQPSGTLKKATQSTGTLMSQLPPAEVSPPLDATGMSVAQPQARGGDIGRMSSRLVQTDTSAADAAASSDPAGAGDAVVFEFVGPCWVDIRDSTRKFKLFGEMRKGDRRVLEGTPPYSVILGNSPMVRVYVGGQAFDVEAHSRGNVARFTLDPSAAN